MRKFMAARLGVVGAVLLSAFVLIALFAPQVAPFNPVTVEPTQAFRPPGTVHWLGTDNFGRDVFSRILWGTQVSMKVGFLTVVGSFLLGGALGLLSGYFSKLDALIMRFLDGLMAFPGTLLAIAIVAVLGAGELNTIIALVIVYTPHQARILRGSVLGIREMDYVEAAVALGVRSRRVLLRHILPNALSPLVVYSSFTFAQAILSEAALSFLGLGTPPPAPSWGNVLADGRSYLFNAPWISIAPGVAISSAVLAINLIGDGLRDTLDPRLL